MANHIDGIDHVLIAVQDLQASVAAWGKLGFTLTPRGGHPEWGTANHCIMFPGNYLELIGVVGIGASAVADQLRGFLATSGEGVAGLALATHDGAAACRDLRAAGVEAEQPHSLSRLLQLESGPVKPLFSIVRLPENTLPGVSTILCQHVTPELLRRPEWLEHANGTIAVTSMTIAVEDPEALRPGLEMVFGPASTTATDSTVAVHTGNGLLLLCRPDELAQLHPDAEMDEIAQVPAVVALSVATTDTGRAAALLKANGVAFSRDSAGNIRVAGEDASGVFVEFELAR